MKGLAFDETNVEEHRAFPVRQGAGNHELFARVEMLEQSFDITPGELAHRDDLHTARIAVFERASAHDANPPNGACEALQQHAYEPRANGGVVGFVDPALSQAVGCGASSLSSVNDMYGSVLQEVASLGDAFSTAGFELYLVGGIVRDLHLGAPLDQLDFDLTTNARPADIKRLVDPLSTAVWTQGERFGTIGCQVDGRPVEITTHRAESYSDETRKPEVVFGDDIDVDLSRRDFTLNAMAIRVSNGELIDPFDGLGALDRRVLMTPIEPEVSFSDDPLRILRAARFIARYDLAVDPGVMSAGQALIDRMSIVSAERIRDEFDKLLLAPKPSAGLSFLAEVGAWSHIVPSIDPSILDDMSTQLDSTDVDATLRRALVFSHCSDRDRSDAMGRLRYSNDDSRKLRLLLAGFDVVRAGGQPIDASTLRRLISRVGFDHMSLLQRLIDARGVRDRGLAQLFTELEATEDLSDLTPVLTGAEVMALLDLEPGPEVGAAIGVLQERRFNEGPLDADGEADYLRTRYRRR